MKEIIIDGSRMMQVSDNPKILVSLKSKIDFSTFSNSAKEALLKKHFSIDSYRDFEQSHGDKIFGIECNFEELNGIDFKKGCYVGQENTARIKLKNKLSKRLFPLEIINGKINADEDIFYGNN